MRHARLIKETADRATVSIRNGYYPLAGYCVRMLRKLLDENVEAQIPIEIMMREVLGRMEILLGSGCDETAANACKDACRTLLKIAERAEADEAELETMIGELRKQK